MSKGKLTPTRVPCPSQTAFGEMLRKYPRFRRPESAARSVAFHRDAGFLQDRAGGQPELADGFVQFSTRSEFAAAGFVETALGFDELEGADADVVEADVHATGRDTDGFFAELGGIAGGFEALF